MSDLMSVGMSGILASKTALAVTGENIVNANTDGYSRRAVDMQEARAAGNVSMDATQSRTGNGVRVENLKRAQDSFLAGTLRISKSRASELETVTGELGQVSDILSNTDTNLVGPANRLFDAFNQLALQPDADSARQSALIEAKNFAASARELATYVEAQRDHAVTQIKDTLTYINNLSTALGGINQELGRSVSGSSNKVGLLDERDRLLTALAEQVRFTTQERSDGTVDVYLGDSNAGRPLLEGTKSTSLALQQSGSRLEFVLDPYGSPQITSQIIGGRVAGLRTTYDMLGRTVDGVNTLVRGFADAVNEIQQSGVTGEGLAGDPIFTLNDIAITPASANLGTAKLTVALTKPELALNQRLRLKFDDAGSPVLTQESGSVLARGANAIEDYGVKLSLEGTPRSGDSFGLDFISGAATSIKVSLLSSDQFATGKDMLIDPATTNVGTATLSVNKASVNTAVPAPLERIFTNAFTADRLVRPLRPGALTSIPAGINDLTLRSFDQSDLATVNLSAADLQNLSSLEVTLVDGRSVAVDLSTADRSSLQKVVDGLNQSPALASLGLAAQRRGDSLQIVGPGAGTLVGLNSRPSGSVVLRAAGGTSLSNPVSLVAGERGDPVRLFTRDGVQVSGPALSSAEANALLTVQNGFSAGARYVPPGASGTYRDLQMFQLSYPDGLEATQRLAGGVASAKLPLEWAENGAPALIYNDGTAQPGRTALLSLTAPDGRVFTAAPAPHLINEGDPAKAGKALLDALNAQGVSAGLVGATVPAAVSGAAATLDLRVSLGSRGFIVRVAAPDDPPDFRRASVSLIADDGGSVPLTAGMTQDGRLALGAPRGLAGERLQLGSNSASVLSALGFNGAGDSVLSGTTLSALPASGSSFQIALGGQTYTITANGTGSPDVTDATGAATTALSASFDAVPGGFQLRLNTSAALAGTAVTAAGSASQFGFNLIEGFQGSIDADGLSLSAASSGGQALTAHLDFTAPIAGEVRLKGPLPEDLLVVSARAAGAGLGAEWQSIDAGYSPPATSIKIVVSAPDASNPSALLLTFTDEATGDVLALRDATRSGGSFTVNGQVFKFTGGLSGGLTAGDQFRVEFGRGRPGDNRNVAEMAALAKRSLFASGGGSFLDMVNAESAKLANDVQISKTSLTAAELTRDEIAAKYAEKTGVNLDQEAGDLVRYQQAYQAAAQVLNTAKVLFDAILQIR